MNDNDNAFDYQPIENPKTSIMPVSIRYGLILGLVGIAFSLLSHVLGMTEISATNTMVSIVSSLISFGITIAIIVMAIKFYRDNQNQGFLSIGQGLGIGALMGLVSGLMTAIYMYIFFTYIDSGMIDAIIAQTEADMEAQGQSDEDIENAMSVVSMFMTPLFFAGSALISSPIMGGIFGLIAGLFLKHEAPKR